MTTHHLLKRPLPLAVAFHLAFAFAHFISLPLLITWDGHDYIDLAEVLGSERFPKDWRLLRTPLFPLALKLSFALFGRGALAAKVVTLGLAVLGSLLLASAVRRVAGDWAASATLVLLALYPTLIVYGHTVLTETGSFFFLALVLRLSLWMPETAGEAWKKAVSLGLAIGAAYYWRQTVLLLAPWFALLHLLSVRPWGKDRRAWVLVGAQVLLLMALPWGLSRFWVGQFGAERFERLNAVVLRSFVVRQAVLPPEDPRLANAREDYRAAIVQTKQEGFLSGIPWPQAAPIADQVQPPKGRPFLWLATIVRQYPGRYAAAVGRSLLFFAGFDGAENTNRSMRHTLLSPVIRNSLIAEGPKPATERHKREFSMAMGPGLVQALVRGLGAPYEGLVIVCNLVALGLLGFALARLDLKLLAFSGTPVVFALVHAVALMSMNRFMVPVYPVTLACGVIVAFRWLSRASSA